MRAYSNDGVYFRDTREPQFLLEGETYFDHVPSEMELREVYPNHQEAVRKSLVPNEVSMRQARLALFQDGLLDQVQPIIDMMTEPQKTSTQIQWDYASIVRRDDDLVVALSSQLNLTERAVDDLFVLAATL